VEIEPLPTDDDLPEVERLPPPQRRPRGAAPGRDRQPSEPPPAEPPPARRRGNDQEPEGADEGDDDDNGDGDSGGDGGRASGREEPTVGDARQERSNPA
jgi:hypothetical protein